MDTPHSNYGKSRLIYPALADVVNTRLMCVMKAVNNDLVCLMKDFGSPTTRSFLRAPLPRSGPPPSLPPSPWPR